MTIHIDLHLQYKIKEYSKSMQVFFQKWYICMKITNKSSMNTKEKDIVLFYSIMEWIKKNKKKPSMKSEDSHERRYANRLKDLRRSIRGKKTNTPFHNEYNEIIKEFGFYSMFEK